MIRIARQLVVEQCPAVVWQRLNDFPRMAGLLPNVVGWAVPADDHFLARLRGRLAWMPFSATVKLVVVDRRELARLQAEGTVRRGDGEPSRNSKPMLFARGQRDGALARFAICWDLTPQGQAATRLSYALDLEVESALESWVPALLAARLDAFDARLARVLGDGRRAAAVAA